MPASDSVELPPRPASTVLVLSHDAVAAALLGALVEILGYAVRFRRAPESPDDAVRRVRPRIALIDCEDPLSCTDEIVGRASMRGVSCVIFGASEALDRVRVFALEHDISVLLMPPDTDDLDQLLREAQRD